MIQSMKVRVPVQTTTTTLAKAVSSDTSVLKQSTFVSALPAAPSPTPVSLAPTKKPIANPNPTHSQRDINDEFNRVQGQLTNNIVLNQVRNAKPDLTKLPNLAQLNSAARTVIPSIRIPLNNSRDLLETINNRIETLRRTNPNHPDIPGLEAQRSQLTQRITQLDGILKDLEALVNDIGKKLEQGKGADKDLMLTVRFGAIMARVVGLINSVGTASRPAR